MLFIAELLKGLINFLIYAVLARVILSLVIQFMMQRGGSVHPVVMLLNTVVGQITDPILNPIRRINAVGSGFKSKNSKIIILSGILNMI